MGWRGGGKRWETRQQFPIIVRTLLVLCLGLVDLLTIYPSLLFNLHSVLLYIQYTYSSSYIVLLGFSSSPYTIYIQQGLSSSTRIHVLFYIQYTYSWWYLVLGFIQFFSIYNINIYIYAYSPSMISFSANFVYFLRKICFFGVNFEWSLQRSEKIKVKPGLYSAQVCRPFNRDLWIKNSLLSPDPFKSP